jgi:predicted SnoaL-like aldol condensation-catalyzing enzyme
MPARWALVALLAVLAGCEGATSRETETTLQSVASADGTAPDCIREVADGFKALFYDGGRVREAYETYVAEDYRQHNPMAQDGREAAIAFLEPIYERNPQHRMTVHRMIVEDPYIVVHLHGQSSPDDLGAAAVDILLVEDCKIVEHWDITQPVPADPINKNGMF